MRTRLLLLTLTLLLASCGSTSTASAPTATPPLTTTPLPTVTLDQVKVACGASVRSGAYQKVGDLYIAVGSQNNVYPSFKLPDHAPLAPYNLTTGPLNQTLWVNPMPAYYVSVCNSSRSATYHVDAATARVEAFTAESSAPGTWLACDGFFQHGSVGEAGCGGQGVLSSHRVTFDANGGVGATAPLDYLPGSQDFDGHAIPGFPFSLAPGKSVALYPTLKAPPTSGLYTFAFGLTVNGASQPFVAIDRSLLLDPKARVWSGRACQAAPMKSQIPTIASDDKYICPETT